jgi:hypothetical protein
VIVKNHRTREKLKVDLIDPPLATVKAFHIRVNGKWAQKVPWASKSKVMAIVRQWLVQH